MSSFTMKLKHRETGEYHSIFAIDDYFAHYVYGYQLPNDTVITVDELFKLYFPRNETDE